MAAERRRLGIHKEPDAEARRRARQDCQLDCATAPRREGPPRRLRVRAIRLVFQMALKALITGCLVSAACVSLGVVSAVVAFVVCLSSAPYAIVYAVFYGAAIGGTISV